MGTEEKNRGANQ